MSHYLKERYQKEIAPALEEAIGTDNVMQIPRITKVVVNIGVGEALDNAKALEAAVAEYWSARSEAADQRFSESAHRRPAGKVQEAALLE